MLRIGVFYDGTYFSHVSNHYLYEHSRKARISIGGLHEFIREEVAKQENTERRHCQIVDAHYFRGRLSAQQATELDDKQLYKDRQFDDVLMNEGVVMHFLPVKGKGVSNVEEKGIDVWFALEAFELAMYKRFDVSVLITGDGDFVPLIRKLNTLGTRVMLLGWDFEGEKGTTKTNQKLIEEATYTVMMSDEIDARNRRNGPIIDGIFLKHKPGGPRISEALSNSALGKPRIGRVVNLNDEKGFGFLAPELGGENVFFHVSELPSDVVFEEVSDGDRFEFETVQKPDGKLAATRMRCAEK